MIPGRGQGGGAGPDWESDLNPEQLRAVTAGDGPMVVFAGAGSGKTRVITYRIMHLVLARSEDPRSILGLTFTNKAAGEMRERVQRRMPGGAEPPWLGTFHAFSARLLRVHGERIGIPRDFTIYDDDDQISVVKRILKLMDLDPQEWSPRRILSALDRAKRDGAPRPAAREGAPPWSRDRVIADVMEEYQRRLAEQRALDFNDLLVRSVELLEGDAVLRGRLQARFRHVLVDEFQDTNGIQVKLLGHLAPPPDANLCVVGDDDQSIYRWRGADVRNILEFGRLYRGARVVTLTRNYRSTGNILAAAAAVIARNPDRAEKKLAPCTGPGDPVVVHACPTEEDEARFVARRVRRLEKGGVPFARQAVLYRLNAQSRAIEEELMSSGIPYRIVGGLRFFDRAEIRDLVAYLRVVHNPADDVAFLRVVNVPPRGLGDRTIEILRDGAGKARTSLHGAATAAIEGGGEARAGASDIDGTGGGAGTGAPIGPAARRGLKAFLEAVGKWRAMAAESRASAVLCSIVDDTEYRRHLLAVHGDAADQRILNVDELIALADGFAQAREGEGLGGVLEEIALRTDVDDLAKAKDALVLMTVHSAKGLEFDSVIVTGLEEDVFPYRNPFSEEETTSEEMAKELEEERRLFYVAVTRARRHLALSHATSRRLFGGSARFRAPSMFLDEIPAEVVAEEADREERPARGGAAARAGGAGVGAKAAAPGTILRPRDSMEGRKVFHDRFGEGKVLMVEDGVRRKLTIKFGDGKTRKILEEFVRTRK